MFSAFNSIKIYSIIISDLESFNVHFIILQKNEKSSATLNSRKMANEYKHGRVCQILRNVTGPNQILTYQTQ